MKQLIYTASIKNNKLDCMRTEREIYDKNNNNAIAISLPSLRSNKIKLIQDVLT